MLFDHVDLRVRSLAEVRPLYDALLSALGCTQISADVEARGYHRPGESGGEPFVWIVQDPAHRASANRIAFAAKSRGEVDRVAAVAREAGACALEPAQIINEYGPNYYAAFFEDIEGNKLEVCCRRPG